MLIIWDISYVELRKLFFKFCCASKGNERIVELLIKNVTDINVIWFDLFERGYTPLHYIFTSVCSPTSKMIELLIEHGANINAVTLDNVGCSILEFAISNANGKYIESYK